MPAKRSNKTARVLNLIATPSEAAAAEPISTPDVATEKQPDPVAKQPKEKVRSSASKSKKTAKTTNAAPSTDTAAPANPSAVAHPPVDEQSHPETPSISSVPTPQPVVPILQNVREKEQQLSDDIRSGLLQALNEAEASASSATDDAPRSTPKTEDTEKNTAAPENTDFEKTEPQPDPQDTVPSPQPEPPQTDAPSTQVKAPSPKKEASEEIYTPTGEQDVVYTNVLQELVEEIAPYYIDHMLQCHCQRCIVDMKALALTNLPSKYVVLEKSKRNAFMSVYAARYDKLLSVQMMRACVIVNEHPHH